MICAIGLGYLLGDCRPTSLRWRMAGLIRAVPALMCVLAIGYTYGNRSLATSLRNQSGSRAEYRDVAAWLAANTLRTDKVATIEIGVIGYLSQRPLLDTMGLVSPEMDGHLVGWVETLTYSIWQHKPDYAVTLKDTAWDVITPQRWFREYYHPVATFGPATIYERRELAAAPGYTVSERTEFAAGFAITGLEAPQKRLTPGEQLNLILHVEVVEKPAGDCGLISMLVDTVTYDRISMTEDRPFGGGYSCLAWQPGDSIPIPLQIAVPQDIAPGTYRVGIEFVELTRGTFFTLKLAPEAKEVQIGWFRVGDPEPQAVDARRSDLAVHWANDIKLAGVALADRPLVPGELLVVGFEWLTQRTPDRDLTFFVHLVDSGGNILAQTDRRPFGGRFPTTVWLPGEILKDTYSVQIPEDAPAVEYRMRVGFYDNLGVLPLEDGSSDHYMLGKVILVRSN